MSAFEVLREQAREHRLGRRHEREQRRARAQLQVVRRAEDVVRRIALDVEHRRRALRRSGRTALARARAIENSPATAQSDATRITAHREAIAEAPAASGARAARRTRERGGSPWGGGLRCARMRSIAAGSSRLAITLSFPPHRRQRSMSIANTRLSRCIQVMLACSGTCPSAAASVCPAPRPRPAGMIAARSAWCGANTPWYLVRCLRGGGTVHDSGVMKA